MMVPDNIKPSDINKVLDLGIIAKEKFDFERYERERPHHRKVLGSLVNKANNVSINNKITLDDIIDKPTLPMTLDDIADRLARHQMEPLPF